MVVKFGGVCFAFGAHGFYVERERERERWRSVRIERKLLGAL